MGEVKVKISSMQVPTKEQLKAWRKNTNSSKVGQFEKAVNRKVLKRKAKVELMKLVTTLNLLCEKIFSIRLKLVVKAVNPDNGVLEKHRC